MTTPIPRPPTIPFLGNAKTIDRDVPVNSFKLLAAKYGEIYRLTMMGREIVVVNSQALVNEVSDEKKFKKTVNASLMQVRNATGDGLFTAYNDEPNWGKAHRILMPAFGALSMKNMMEDMRDICSQLLLKWERFGPKNVIDPSDDFTRTALDAIALCTMSYRLNSFYTEHQPVFAQAMVDFLKESFFRTSRPSVVQAFMSGTTAKYEDDQRIMLDLVNQIINERKENPTDKKDLLNLMLNAKDPKTGEGLPNENIVYNLLTFLIAGHETSSGMMSFMTYYLVKHPETMRKLREEVDTVLQGRPIQYEDFSKMPYLQAVMRETMRLSPTAPARTVSSVEDTTLAGGKYAIKAGIPIVVQTVVMQRDPAVWGEDANEFRPERMLDGKFEALPPNAWQPFGFGARACIGRPFAWQEVSLVMASVIQKFNLSMVDPSYDLQLKQALTIKPKDFYIRASVRKDGPVLYTSPLYGTPASRARDGAEVDKTSKGPEIVPLYVYYGSNTGTSEGFAQRIATGAAAHGFLAKIGTLDSTSGRLPLDGPVIILTSSYEGQPADNAAQFVDWLENSDASLKGVKYAVFGCGNSDWVQTYQRIPALCDDLIAEQGGTRLLPRGSGDASKGNFFQVFDEFESSLWDVLGKEYDLQKKVESQNLEVTTVPADERAKTLRQSDVGYGTVVENKIITKPGASVKRHLEFKLPEGMSYTAGDYLAILPHNPLKDIHRVFNYFGLSTEQHVVINSQGPSSLPIGKNVALLEVLSGYVELSQPATTRDLRTLADAATNEVAKSYINTLLSSYTDEVLGKRVSVLDVLEKHHGDIPITLGQFLEMLPSMRIRQYSISSSPLWNPEHVTLTISVVENTSYADASKKFLGVATNYMSSLKPGDRLQMTVRRSATAFHPPQDPTVPMVMFCAGSGLAPMRGFLQDRAMQKMSGREVGKSLLFFGCRSPDMDYLYGDNELKEWAKLGIVELRPTFSRASEKSEGCKYIQDRVWHNRVEIRQYFRDNAKFFCCGSGKMAQGVKVKFAEMIASIEGTDLAAGAAVFERISVGRFATDIFD